jgi:hypothetical protein
MSLSLLQTDELIHKARCIFKEQQANTARLEQLMKQNDVETAALHAKDALYAEQLLSTRTLLIALEQEAVRVKEPVGGLTDRVMAMNAAMSSMGSLLRSAQQAATRICHEAEAVAMVGTQRLGRVRAIADDVQRECDWVQHRADAALRALQAKHAAQRKEALRRGSELAGLVSELDAQHAALEELTTRDALAEQRLKEQTSRNEGAQAELEAQRNQYAVLDAAAMREADRLALAQTRGVQLREDLAQTEADLARLAREEQASLDAAQDEVARRARVASELLAEVEALKKEHSGRLHALGLEKAALERANEQRVTQAKEAFVGKVRAENDRRAAVRKAHLEAQRDSLRAQTQLLEQRLQQKKKAAAKRNNKLKLKENRAPPSASAQTPKGNFAVVRQSQKKLPNGEIAKTVTVSVSARQTQQMSTTRAKLAKSPLEKVAMGRFYGLQKVGNVEEYDAFV